MRLTIVGCAGSFPGPDSAASCYLVEAAYDGGVYRLLLDLGSGALGPLQRYVDLADIDAVAVSHLHPDHCMDLCGFYVARKYHPAGPMGRLPVYGPEGLAAQLVAAYGSGPSRGMADEFDFRVYADGDLTLGPLTVAVVRVDHPITTYALKVTHHGRTLVYSADTGPCAALDDVAKGADLLLAEASFLEGADNPPNLHLTAREAADAAERAGVGRLVLTHVPPWHSKEDARAEAAPFYRGRLSMAVPGASYQI